MIDPDLPPAPSFTFCSVGVLVDVDGQQLPATAVGFYGDRVTVIANAGPGLNYMRVVDASAVTRP